MSAVGFVVPVPRQEDRFKIDMFVHLNEETPKGPKPIGLSLGVQVKSSERDIELSPDEALLLAKSQLPVFVAVLSPSSSELRVYGTFQRYLLDGTAEAVLRFGNTSTEETKGSTKEYIFLGDPVVIIDLDKLDSPVELERKGEQSRLRNHLKAYVFLDMKNIVGLGSGQGVWCLPTGPAVQKYDMLWPTFRVLQHPRLCEMAMMGPETAMRLRSMAYAIKERWGGPLDADALKAVRDGMAEVEAAAASAAARLSP